jgi:membrane-associated protease RseP (regulator of RpoE activity)
VVHAVNFLPIFPLDGARIIRGILASISRPLSRALVWAGPLFAIGITVLLKKPVFLVLLFVSLVNRRDNLDAKKMEPLQTLSVWFLFFGLLLLDILLFIWAAEPFIGNVEALKHVIRH